MGARDWEPLAVAIVGMLLAVMSYGVKNETLALLTYVSGLIAAALSLLHWVLTSARGRA